MANDRSLGGMKPIQAIQSSDERLAELSQIMARSNQEARQASRKIVGNRKYRLFRAALRGEDVAGLTERQLKAVSRIGKRRKAVMLEVESIRDEVIETFIPCMYGVANRFAFFHPDHETGDYFGEAAVIAVDTVYGYTDLRIKFVTYLRRTLINELTRYVRSHRAYGLSSRSSYYLDLLSLTLQVTEALEASGKRADYHNVRAHLEPICQTKKRLGRVDLDRYLPGVMSFIATGSDVTTDSREGDEINDYTADALRRASWSPSQLAEVADLELALMASITEDERLVLRLKMNELTMEEVAARSGLTKGQAKSKLDSAREKISERLKHFNAA